MAPKKGASTRGSKEAARPYGCDKCTRYFARPSHLARHKLSHRPQALANHACRYCGKSFTRNDVLLRHIRGVHQTYPQQMRIGRLSCSNCLRRKSRCDRCNPCQSCVDLRATCRYPQYEHQRGTQADPFLDVEAHESPLYQAAGVTDQVELAHIGHSPANSFCPGGNGVLGLSNEAFPEPSNTWEVPNTSPEISNGPEHGLRGSAMPSFDGPIEPGPLDSIFGQSFSSFGLGFAGFDWLNFQPQESPVDSEFLRNAPVMADEAPPGSGPSTAPPSRAPLNHSLANYCPSNPCCVSGTNDGSRQNVQPWPFDHNRGKRRELPSSKQEFPPLEQVLRDSSSTPSSEGPKSALETLIDMLSKSHVPEDWSQDQSVSPGVYLLQRTIDQYFAEFHDILPVIHVPTFALSKAPGVLLACMSSVGAMLLRDTDAEKNSAALCDLSSRMILWLGGRDSSNFFDLSYLTASCLHQIYSLGSGNRQLYLDADRSRGVLVGSLRGMGLLVPRISVDPDIPQSRPTDCEDLTQVTAQWLSWRDREQEKRLTWASFEYDCSLATLTGRRGAVDLAELPRSLPCVEELWKAPSAQSWRSLASQLPSLYFGAPLAETLDAAMMGKNLPSGSSSWGKRLCCQVIGRLLWDLKQQEVLNFIRALYPPPLGSAWEQAKLSLLRSFDNVTRLIQSPVSVQEIIDYNIAHLIYHYCHLFSVDDTMELILHIVRHLPTTNQSPHHGTVTLAKQNLIAKFANDHRKTRRLIWHAAQITAVANEYVVSAPCEILRMFMGAILLLAVAKYYPGVLHVRSEVSGRAGVILLDRVDTSAEGTETAEHWIQHGGPASVVGVEELSSAEFGNVIFSRTRSLLGRVRFWGLAQKFIEILQLLNDTDV